MFFFSTSLSTAFQCYLPDLAYKVASAEFPGSTCSLSAESIVCIVSAAKFCFSNFDWTSSGTFFAKNVNYKISNLISKVKDHLNNSLETLRVNSKRKYSQMETYSHLLLVTARELITASAAITLLHLILSNLDLYEVILATW